VNSSTITFKEGISELQNMANYLLLVFSSLIAILNIGCVKEIETVSNEKPYSVLISKERSYYQAIKAKERLLNLDIESYLIATRDSIEREWFGWL
jgi:hypothetical protein